MRALALVLVTLPSAIAAQTTDIAATADRVFARFTRETPGCAVGVSQQGRTLLAKGYGMANLETGTPITSETIFESGSVAKQFTAAATLLLVADGKLRLDDRVQKFIPELPEYGRPLTVRHLLSHTSGLREWSNLVALDGWPRGSRVHSQHELVDVVVSQQQLNYPVGDHYSYTNSGYGLLVTIIERVSGMPFTRFTAERLFSPLGLRHTSWRDDFERIVPGRAQAYTRRGTGWALDMPFENVVGPGGMLTTVGDWLRWNGALDRKTLGAWLVDSLESQATLTSGRRISYAMGLTVNTWRGEREVAHSGSTGGYSTYLLRLPARGISVAVLCNFAGSDATGMARQMAASLIPDLPPVAAPDTVAVEPGTMAKVAGVYRSSRTYEPLFLGTTGGRGGRGGTTNLRGLRGGGLAIGNTRVSFDASPDLLRSGGFLQLPASGDTVLFLRVGNATWAPDANALQAFTGEYRTPELRTTWTAAVDSGRLVLSARRGSRVVLTPAYEDAFTAGGLGTVWFSRDEKGQVNVLHFSAARLWNLAVPRVKPESR